MLIKEVPQDLSDKTVLVFNYDFIVKDPSYQRLLSFAKQFNKGQIKTFHELAIGCQKTIIVEYKNRIKVKYIHDKESLYLDINSLMNECVGLVKYL